MLWLGLDLCCPVKGTGVGGLGGEYCTSGNILGGFREYE